MFLYIWSSFLVNNLLKNLLKISVWTSDKFEPLSTKKENDFDCADAEELGLYAKNLTLQNGKEIIAISCTGHRVYGHFSWNIG